MIVVETSAAVAILEDEDDALLHARAIQDADNLTMSAVNPHEYAIVLRRRRGPKGEENAWNFLTENDIRISPFNEEHPRKTSEAFGRCGPRARKESSTAAAIQGPGLYSYRCCSGDFAGNLICISSLQHRFRSR